MDGIRIIELPAAKMVSSGDRDLQGFDEWWSAVDKERKDRFFPRDFMWYDPEAQRLVWYYALPEGVTETAGYETVDFPGGIYAVAVSRDQDDNDGQRVYKALHEWVKGCGCFALDERPGRPAMFHVITSDQAFRALGYRQLDLYVPIRAVD